jgi:hypothetical protein
LSNRRPCGPAAQLPEPSDGVRCSSEDGRILLFATSRSSLVITAAGVNPIATG